MQKDFHYYCIAVIALAAGYPPDDARTIAYASQYADDETIDIPIAIENSRKTYRPIRTAYRGIEYVLALSPDKQREVLVPFHFIPNEPFGVEGERLYQTVEDSPFAHDILENSIGSRGDNRLHRIGLALHTFADTWAHHGFSGIYDEEGNAVRVLQTRIPYDKSYFDQLAASAQINIGHISALSIPDYPYEIWQCHNRPKRTNPERFIHASRAIFERLLNARQPDDTEREERMEQWDPRITDEISNAFDFENRETGIRCEEWKKLIPTLFKNTYDEADLSSLIEYDEWDWIQDALTVHGTSLNDILSTAEGEGRGRNKETRLQAQTWESIRKGDTSLKTGIEFGIFKLKPDFKETEWYRFQRAARKHRDFVTERLPK